MIDSAVTRRVVGDFLRYVRSGQEPQRAAEFMAPTVRAHQVQSEDLATVERTPDDYAEHVREMTATWGAFDLTIEEFLVDGARAHVRLAQVGHHLAPVDGIAPTGRTVRQINSVVYNVEDGLITEYWIQIDRAGLLAQLRDGS
ncbi:ester cyclase [Micromonospora terminaliae]|uniref:Ester cyclase n=1 Tax=Micromonospora terminaliae TaxID=1914461 RepID=A0AAJ3DH64_9ACTN|nr:ester cyclase [Micromonospora terminaliae]NES26134.1 ester cyclase [Micromonospora terminaliae]QGL50333.1 ester cyclase [Micromonospora terminaliae]